MLVLLQFDATSLPVIERLIEAGRLPSLASLRSRGQWSALEADTDLFEAGTYPTLYTGKTLSEHGLYYPFVWSAAEQRLSYMDKHPKPETVWERLGRSGLRSLVIDPYQLWVSPDSPGVSISGWQFSHNIIPRWKTPRKTFNRLASRFGNPPRLDDVAGPRTVDGLLQMRRKLLMGPDRAASATIDLLANEDFDFVWLTFIGSHQAGHHLWDLSVASDEADREARQALESALEDIYIETDRAIGRIAGALPEGADVIVFSSLGMGPSTTRSDFLPDMLKTVLAGDRASPSPSADSSIWRVRAAVPPRIRSAVARALPGDMIRESVARLYLRGVDWSRTRAFALPGDHFGNVRLNVRGRERFGVVDPGDVASLLDEIGEGLASFSDPDGSPSIARVERIADQFAGDRGGHLPDLVIRWSDNPAARLRTLQSPRFGAIARRGVGIGRAGNHAPGAWALLVPGRSTIRPLTRAPQIVDMAATACALLGADPSGLSGESLFNPA